MDARTAKGTKNIVILGGGFGGIACALTLEKLMRKKTSLLEEFNLFLIDKKNYHLYAPFLYEVATTSPEDGSLLDFKKIIAIPIPEIINGKKIEFNRRKIVDIDPKGKNVYLEGSAPLPYEYLVLAFGAEPAYFGIPGVRDHAHSLKWLDDAIHIRDAIRKKFDQKNPGETLSILIAGGGTTGVEVASELVGYIKKLNRKTNQNIRSDITLIEGASTVLPGFDDWVVKKSTKRLRMIGIHLELGRMVSRLDDQIAYIKQTAGSYRRTERNSTVL
jgi:NADH dehydrogenase